MIELPEILNMPEKMLPFLEGIGNYRFYLAEGGRSSAKTNSFGRIILYICDKKKVRVVCGREIQKTIDESVYRILVDLITKYGLDWDIQKTKLIHRKTGSEILFKGFREQGRSNIKGLEGVDILWIDEAEAITKETLNIIIPTIRKPNSLIWFSMNRFVRNDPVYEFCTSRSNCLHVHIDYIDNPFCPQEVLDEAEACKQSNEQDYNHIWLGQPMDSASDYLFNSAKLYDMLDIVGADDGHLKQRVVGIDFAAQGGDLCVLSCLDRISHTNWALTLQESWNYTDPMHSIGKIVDLLGQLKPDVSILDVGGMGTVVYSRLKELGVDIHKFDGASTQGIPQEYSNARAYGYYTLNNFVDNQWIRCKNKDTITELEQIRYKYLSSGKRLIVSKEEMRKNKLKSPDRADSLMMAIYAVKQLLGRTGTGSQDIVVKTTKKWGR